jgi:hypothetical protein
MRQFSRFASFAIIPFALIPLASVGCGKKDPFIGKWNVSGAKMPPGLTATMEFQEGNKLKMGMNGNIAGMEIKVDGTGTYKVEGEKITTTVSEMKLDDSKLPAAFRAQAKAGLENSEMKKPQTSTFKIEGETITLNGSDGTTTLTKVKS